MHKDPLHNQCQSVRRRGLGVLAAGLALGLLAGASPWNEARQLALSTTDRTVPGTDLQKLEQLVETIAEVGSELLAEKAQAHARRRTEALQRIRPDKDIDRSPYRDMMRYPRANRGEAVTVSGSVVTLKADETKWPGRLVEIAPAKSPEGRIAILVSKASEEPELGREITASGLFVKRLVIKGEDDQRIVPLLVAAEWRERRPLTAPETPSWQVIEDGVLGISEEESVLYYHVLKQAATTPAAKLREQARQFQAKRRAKHPKWVREGQYWMFLDLMKNPEEIRGHPVTLTGYSREVRAYPAGENQLGIKMLYEIWLFTDMSQSNPAVVVTTEIPEGLPIGDTEVVSLRVTGYFFKLYGYHGQSKARIAPMLLAGPVQVRSIPEPEGAPWWFIGPLGGGILLVLAWIIVSFLRIRRGRARRTTSEEPPDFSGL